MKYQYIGVDLATAKLDVYSKMSGYVPLRNDEAGRQRLIDIVKQAGPNALVAYESTGNVSKRFASFLYPHNSARQGRSGSWHYRCSISCTRYLQSLYTTCLGIAGHEDGTMPCLH